MENINSRTDYQNIVKSIASDIVELALYDGELINDGCVNADELIDSINDDDLVFEQVDCSHYVIYNAYHSDILKYSDNDNALIDEFGSDAIADADSFSDVMERSAFWALYTDVWEFIHNDLASVMPDGEELV